ncbi:MAG: tetratricopeptide repeat protein, partial [Flavobacteriales bacterium]|nr:tetratricopeptide repeat protein [Flavobacteriales bacterium]
MKTTVILGAAFLATLTASAQGLPEAVKLTDREQYEKATAVLNNVLAADPQNAEAWFLLGENYFASERSDSAAFCFGRGASVNGRYPLNHVGVGKVMWTKGQASEAKAQFDKAIANATDKANKFGKPLQARTYREIAQAYAEGNQKDLARSQEMIAKALELDPKDPETYILKGNVLFEANPRDGSAPLENYKQAAQLDALSAKPVSKKGFMYYRAKNYSAAIEEYTKAIGIDASYAPAYSGRAEAYFMARDFEKATADMNKYLELNTGNTSARVRYAQFLFLVGKHTESLNEIKDLEGKGVKNLTLQRIKGYDQVELKDAAGAKATLEAYFAEQSPEKVIAGDWEYYGKALVGLGQDSLGAEHMLKAARMDRTKDYNFVEAAKAFSKAKAYDKAIGALKEKIAGGKPETNDFYYLGDAALKGKRWMTADSAWATYIERNPNAYQGYKFRARTQNGMDSLETKTFAAKTWYEQMLARMKPEEKEKYKADQEEALNYMGLFFLYSKEARDLPKA